MEMKSELVEQHPKVRTDDYELKCRERVKDINSRAVSSMNTVHIDKAIDSKLFQFGVKSASTNEIEQKIKSHNYIMGLKKEDQSEKKDKYFNKFVVKEPSTQVRPYTASTLLNDKPQVRIVTPNLSSQNHKLSLGDLISQPDNEYAQELKRLEIVEDLSEDNYE
jgi:hypothetical protein